MLAAVDMRPELDSLLTDVPKMLKAEPLEASAVGQRGAIPCHEPRETSRVPDRLDARPEIQVVRISKQDRRSHPAQVVRIDRFHGTLRSDRHEGGCWHIAMGCVKRPQDGRRRRSDEG